jgi:predicted nucleic acid-binding protein
MKLGASLSSPRLHPQQNILGEYAVAARYKKPCFDSSVFIAGLRGGEICGGIKRGVVFSFLWERAKAGEFPVFISAVALAEVYKKKSRVVAGSAILDEFLECVDEPFVHVIEVDREIGLKAHALCRKYSAQRLYPNDAMHLACALRAECDYLLAWDGPLTSIVHPDIIIEEPTIFDKTLFTENEHATAEEVKTYVAQRQAEEQARIETGNARVAEERHAAADSLADQIVARHRSGNLPTPFTAKDVRNLFKDHFESSHLSTVLPNYCEGGDQVKRGRLARFQRVARGKYVAI